MNGPPVEARYQLRLYVAGAAPNSVAAQANLRRVVETLGATCAVEVVDVFQNPRRALEDGVFLTPALVRVSPSPPRRIVGSLDDVEGVARLLVESGSPR